MLSPFSRLQYQTIYAIRVTVVQTSNCFLKKINSLVNHSRTNSANSTIPFYLPEISNQIVLEQNLYFWLTFVQLKYHLPLECPLHPRFLVHFLHNVRADSIDIRYRERWAILLVICLREKWMKYHHVPIAYRKNRLKSCPDEWSSQICVFCKHLTVEYATLKELVHENGND